MSALVQKLIDCPEIPHELESLGQELIDRSLRETPPADGKPLFIHLAGIPGSGKSTYAKRLLGQSGRSPIALVNFDDIMERIPAYQAERVHDPAAAFKRWEIPARAIGYFMLLALIEGKRNILFDNGAAVPAHVELLRRCKEERGYRIEMHYLKCSFAEAWRRIQLREAETGRHTPQAYLEDRQKILWELLPKYQKIVDRFHSESGTMARMLRVKHHLTRA